MNTIGNINFTDNEKRFIMTVINIFGSGQHPVCTSKTFSFFTVDYVKELLNSSKVIKELNQLFIPFLNDVKRKL